MHAFKSLQQDEIEAYQQKGYVKVPRKLFNGKDYNALKETINNVFAANGGKRASTAVGYVHFRNPEILFWVLSENVLNIAEDILGPNIGLWACTLFYKKAHTNEKAYWHKDTSGLIRYNLFEDRNLLNFTIALSDADVSNGCVRYIPGTHREHIEHDWVAPKSEFISNSLSIRPELLNLSSAENMELNENEVSLHNVNVVHGSEPNLSDRDRIILSLRLFSASTRCNLENFEKNNLLPRPFLVRGKDLANSQLKVLFLK